MAWTEFAYAVGQNVAAAGFTLFETTFTLPVLTAPGRVPRGSVTSKAADGSEVTDGWQIITLEQVGEPFGFTLFTNLTTYVTAVWGSFDPAEENADLSLKARGISGVYAYWNVLAHLPLLGTDYTHENTRYVRDLKLRHTVLNAYTPA